MTLAYRLKVISSIAIACVLCSPGFAATTKSFTSTPEFLPFGIAPTGATSSARSVVLTNTGTALISIGGIAATGQFSVKSNCGTTLAVGASCTLLVSFAPTVAGSKQGAVEISTDASDKPRIVTLAGLAAPTSSTAASSDTASLKAGWNLVGNGTTGTLDVPTSLGDGTKVITVWKWLPATSNWAFYTPTLSDGGAAYAASKGYSYLTTVNSGEGFWVNLQQPLSIQLPVAPYIGSSAFQKSLSSGWGLISIGDRRTPSGFNQALSTTPPSPGAIPENLTSLWAWDTADAKWYFYAPSLEKSGGLTQYIAEKSYLDFGTKTLEPTGGLWVNANVTNAASSEKRIAGVVAKAGPIAAATVSAYAVNSDGSKGSLLGTGTTSTDGTGRFSLTLATSASGPVQIEATGGSYKSAHTGSTIWNSTVISGIVDSVPDSGTATIAVTPLSDMTVARAKSLLAAGTLKTVAEANQAAQAVIGMAYGLKASPQAIPPKFDSTSITSDPWGAQVGVIMSALDTLAHRTAPGNPEAIYPALSSDIADGRFDGKAAGVAITVDGFTMPPTVGTKDFIKSVAVTYSAATSGLRPAYVDAHIKAGTIIETYEATIVPVFVASTITDYVPTPNLDLATVTHVEGGVLGYSCDAGALIWNTAFDPNSHSSSNPAPVCSLPSYYCDSGNPKYASNYDRFTGKPEPTCPLGGIVGYRAGSPAIYTAPSIEVYTASNISVYTAAAIDPYAASTLPSSSGAVIDAYSASTISGFSSANTIGAPEAKTIAVYTGTVAHIFTEAERAAMLANDAAAGDAAAAKLGNLGTLNPDQINAFDEINGLIQRFYNH